MRRSKNVEVGKDGEQERSKRKNGAANARNYIELRLWINTISIIIIEVALILQILQGRTA